MHFQPEQTSANILVRAQPSTENLRNRLFMWHSVLLKHSQIHWRSNANKIFRKRTREVQMDDTSTYKRMGIYWIGTKNLPNVNGPLHSRSCYRVVVGFRKQAMKNHMCDLCALFYFLYSEIQVSLQAWLVALKNYYRSPSFPQTSMKVCFHCLCS